MSGEIFDCLKHEQDVCVKTIIPSQNTTFMLSHLNVTEIWISSSCMNHLVSHRLLGTGTAQQVFEWGGGGAKLNDFFFFGGGGGGMFGNFYLISLK